MKETSEFSDKCPRIALARIGMSDWETYLNRWKEVQEDAPAVFENKLAYIQYLESKGFSKGATLAASVVWDLYMMELEDGSG